MEMSTFYLQAKKIDSYSEIASNICDHANINNIEYAYMYCDYHLDNYKRFLSYLVLYINLETVKLIINKFTLNTLKNYGT